MRDASPIDQSRVRDLVVAVFRANGAVIANGDRLVADLGLTASLWQVLDALERAEGKSTVAAIARMMGLTRQSVQRSVDRLTESGLAAGTHNPAHKRAPLVALTDQGKTALAAIHTRELTSIKHTLARLTPAQVVQATEALTAFACELDRQVKAGGTP
ncbi:MarR family winged helix-turn-helix transcriptional regulator [Methylobacterium sp. J-067]|uniref:MarR family winged helix-turn-helix transcriptional regulator n=1 Tax=Methylobacterium sp. J-067 TaxID=2836648 RepID=UPI001FBB77AC|nr:MarR family transcriptional regulator [Methylobacterium sp. J-067]MCJ2023234.1 MarR family transcriptional regulator [Methylobacterium sp. J-067]